MIGRTQRRPLLDPIKNRARSRRAGEKRIPANKIAGALALLTLISVSLVPVTVSAQGLALISKSKSPVIIKADKGVEWRQKKQIYLAKGNATAEQGKTKIRADVLLAHYKKAKDGRTAIWKIVARGNVVITTDKQKATAQRGVYLVGTGIFTLTGNNLKLSTEKQTITATRRIEYRTKAQKAYVVGNATAIECDKRVRADRFVAYMGKDKEGKTSIKRVDALGNVIIVTKQEILRGDRGDYNAVTRIATLTGNVKLTRGDNQLNGKKAIVNLETGVSRMIGKIQAVFSPRGGKEGKDQRRTLTRSAGLKPCK